MNWELLEHHEVHTEVLKKKLFTTAFSKKLSGCYRKVEIFSWEVNNTDKSKDSHMEKQFLISSSTSSSNGPSWHQKVLITRQSTPSDGLFFWQTSEGTTRDSRSSGSPEYNPTNKMNSTKNLKLQLSLFKASNTQREAFRKAKTYLAKIAIVLHDAPGQTLTFPQLIRKMVPLASEDHKRINSNIRVCLSSNKCFAKIPKDPDSKHSKRTGWKLDCSQITAKMVRRHFNELLQLFPELASKVGTESMSKPPDLDSPHPTACKATQVGCQTKFSGPFSIEALLSRGSPSRAPPLQCVQIIRAEQQHRQAEMKRAFSCCSETGEPLLHPSSGRFSI